MRGKHQKKRTPCKTSNVVLVAMGLFVLAFVVTMIVTFWVKGAVPDTLIQYTLGAGGIEALALAGIKIVKVRRGEDAAEQEGPNG